MTYATIDNRSRRASQTGFLHLLKRNLAYQLDAPTLWDVDFRTAVAQAEIEDREREGAYHRLRFDRPDGGAVEIETTRPELLPACVALVAHPDDERYKPLFDKEVLTPLFRARVPVRAHELADPEKGSGIAMICTFGDTTDVTWWRELSLPVRAVIQPNGTLRPITWGATGWESQDADAAQQAYDQIAGQSINKARAKVVELLRENGSMIGEPRPIMHNVKFYEKGDRPLEIVTSRQWFIKTMEFRSALIQRGRQMKWHPDYMRVRFENWVNGLNGDWGISRQRFFGVPFPLWYPIDKDGVIDYSRPIVPDEARLPIDPSTDVPDAYRADQRGQPNGFAGDPDVMDTWATSSYDAADRGRLVRRRRPFQARVSDGFASAGARHHPDLAVLDGAARASRARQPSVAARGHLRFRHRSRPQENVEIERQCRHAICAAGRARLGWGALLGGEGRARRRHDVRCRPDEGGTAPCHQDTERLEVHPGQSRRRLDGPVTAPVDRAMLRNLGDLVEKRRRHSKIMNTAARSISSSGSSGASATTISSSSKDGAMATRDRAAASANSALIAALSVYLRLFAPYLPFATEEVWSWWKEGSVHRAAWPAEAELAPLMRGVNDADQQQWSYAREVLGEIRKRRSEAKQPLKVPIVRAVVADTGARLAHLDVVEADLRAAMRIEAIERKPADGLSVEVEFGAAPPA